MSQQAKYPPRLALAFFRWYCRPDRLEELEGDILELYDIRMAAKMPSWKVDLRFWWDVIRCFKSYSRKSNYLMNSSYALYKSYFKLAWRQLLKNKGPIALNVLGMGLALGFCITVYMIHAYNVEFDSFYGDTSKIFRIHGMKQNGERLERHETTPFALEEALSLDLANVEMVSSYYLKKTVIKKENQYFNEYLALASPNFLDLFNIPLKSGSKASLKDPGMIFLPEETAKKYYGDVSPIGENLTVYFDNNKKVNLTVGGVFQKIPLNTSFNFTAFINRDAHLSVSDVELNDWSSKMTAGQYVKLNSPESKDDAEAALAKYIPLQNKGHEEWKLDRFELIPFIDPLITNHRQAGDW